MEIRVKRETIAERCEICHQTDEYDRKNNSCKRCSVLPSELLQTNKIKLKKKKKLINYNKFLLIILAISGFLRLNVREAGPETFRLNYFPIITTLELLQMTVLGIFLIRGFIILIKIDKIQQYKISQQNKQNNDKV